jgi:hypothetical protein
MIVVLELGDPDEPATDGNNTPQGEAVQMTAVFPILLRCRLFLLPLSIRME